ncbi:MAG: hypothetical protein NO516_01975 [Candidatus Methanomethylicia archaeon]|nr:hypothetical protein [Candidatus Methanomethylicia archaeon]
MEPLPYSIGKAAVGTGKPLLIGSLFYKGDRKVKDHNRGVVDCKKLSCELRAVEALKRRVGLDHAVDLIAETPEAIESYLSVLSSMTEDPILIGGLNEETRIRGYEKAVDLGIVERCGVNSISSCTADSELQVMKRCGIRFAILQTLDPSAIYPEDKIKLLKGSLLAKCEDAGIARAAVDVGIMDFTSAYLALETIKMVKSVLGLAAGCAPSNAAYQPLVCKKITRKSARAINVALNTMMQGAGADFILYGPLKAATYLFEATAIVEAIKAYGSRLAGNKISDKRHPLYTFLPKL